MHSGKMAANSFRFIVVSSLSVENMFQDPSGCLKLWTVLKPIYAVFSHTYIPVIKFNL